MLKLYNKEHEAISAILNIKDYKIEYLLSGEDLLEFSLSISDENINLLQEQCYISNELNEYVVKEIDPNNDFKRFNCILNLEDIKAKSIFNFETENNNIDDTIRLAIAGTGWVLVDSNITKRRTVRLKNTNALKVLREIRKVFKIDYRFDSINKKIYVYEQYGSDKGVYFSDELNLTDLKFPSDTYEYITRIIPIGKDGLKISSVNGGKEYIDNFQYTNKVIEYIWEDNRYTDAQSLKDDAIVKLNELSKPKKVYEANVYDLAKYSDEYNFLEFFLGDTITILSKKDNFKDKQRIVKYIQYPKEPYKNTCELGNTTLTFEELQQENEYKNQVINNITTDNNTLDGSKVDEISTNQIKDFDVEVGRVVNLEAVNAKIDNLVATDVNITGQLNAVKADIGTLNANVANIDELVVKHTATINELNANKANISDLNATNATIYILESKVANIDHILAGNITADNIQAGTITAGSGIIADGAIGNAQISSINVGKIEAGTIDTSKITVAGPNSNLKISGNRLQVFTGIGSNQFERVSLGDINGDGSIYGFRVRGADGQTILIDENGVKEEGITDGSITNEKISDNANIDGSKLDINSVVRNINKDGTEVIQGTKINVNGTNLETKLSTITQKQTEDSERITQAYSKITANENMINLKVDNQTYQTDKNNIDTTLNKNTSEISLLKDKIALKVEQTDITNAINNIQVGGRNLILDSKLILLNGSDNSNNNKSTIVNDSVKIMPINNGNVYNTGIRTSQSRIQGELYTISFEVLTPDTIGFYWYPSEKYRKGSYIKRNSNWQKVNFTYTQTGESNNNSTLFGFFDLIGSHVYYYKNLKLEKGNKATDWSSAPEDTTSEILAVDSKATTINNRVSEITANLNSITQRVSSTETTTTSLTTQMNAVDGKINTAKNEAITDAIAQSNQVLNDAKNYTNTEITKTNNKVSVIETNLNSITSSVSNMETLEYKTKEFGVELVSQRYRNGDFSYFSPQTGLKYDKNWSDNSLIINGKQFVRGDFIPVDFTKKLYCKISFNNWGGGKFYFGIEQYKNNKTELGGNALTKYIVGGDKTVENKFQIKEGYITLDKDCAYIRVRILTNYDNGINTTVNPYNQIAINNISVKQLTNEATSQLITRMSIAEQKITAEAIINTIKSSQTNGKNTFVQQSDIIQLNESWTAKFTDGYSQGITKINKDGITVTSSNVNSKTSMTASGFKITKTDTNEDVFKVNSDGTLNMTGSITTKTSGARSILTGDGINFYNGNTHAGKVSYDTLGAGTVEEARERLWLRSLGGYALKIQSSGDMSLEANGTYNTIFMKGNSLKVTAPTYIYGNLFLNNNNIYAANNVEIKGTLSASSNINVSGKIKAMGNIEINKGTIYLPAGGGNKTAEFIRLANCFMAAVTNSMHFVDINGNKSYLYAASVNTYSLLNNNEILTRSNETALSLMENISVINTSNGYQLKPKYKERTIGESSTGITLKYDEKNKCEAVEVNINKVINILWKAILELKQEYDSFKNTIIEN